MKDQQAREDISNLAKRTFPTTIAYEEHLRAVKKLGDITDKAVQLMAGMSEVNSGHGKEMSELKEKLADQEQRTFRANQMVFELEQRVKKIEARFVVRCPKCKQVIPDKEESGDQVLGRTVTHPA